MSPMEVHTGLWWHNALPALSRWQLTLTDNQAFAFMAVVAIFVGFTQTRFWIILQHALDRWAGPQLQLPGSERPIKKLSQAQAIARLLRSSRHSVTTDMHYVPPSCGIAAISNIVGFLALGALLPWGLGASVETPIVQSSTNATQCQAGWTNPQSRFRGAQLAQSLYSQCWAEKANSYYQCSNTVAGSRPKVVVNANVSCPFPGDICQAAPSPISLEHDLSASDLGVNTKADYRIKHKLTCAPLKTDDFIANSSDHGPFFFIGDPNWRKPDPSISLETSNGPNRHSTAYSGPKVTTGSGFRVKTLLIPDQRPGRQHVHVNNNSSHSPLQLQLHPSLRLRIAQVFVVTLRAGGTKYMSPLRDPLFASHDVTPRRGFNLSVPDFELTAVGCAEQYTVCNGHPYNDCEAWHMPNRLQSSPWLQSLQQKLVETRQQATADDIFPVLNRFRETGSVDAYFAAMGGEPKLLATPLQWGSNGYLTTRLSANQWIKELSAWFETSLLCARIELLDVAKRTLPRTSWGWQRHDPRYRHDVCNRLLLPSEDHTNIAFTPLLIALSTLAFVSLISYDPVRNAAGNVVAVSQRLLAYMRLAVRSAARLRHRGSLRSWVDHFQALRSWGGGKTPASAQRHSTSPLEFDPVRPIVSGSNVGRTT
ncbi:uncharacterized protein HMPREF1541_01392 [Cyphellophora europaea CBS 101466]|uniref:Uncharacterized protein n=1 Tax=Cyphellophora europaea (strain CBS 101466) TaxID=1220924 RepID=W2SEP0_CYPE1|nr:uncharacterized protein HMPREF1541_01392 [Cyphellophora europaea CBS 101466]ETN47201.1 hypothetical protein HMPREF1541_01392 [Cyphellophora europaea CBS 101466]